MGDEDELSDKEKLKIANNFVFNSPPGQTQKVVDDVRALLGPNLLSKSVVQQMGLRVNREQFLAVEVPDCRRFVLVTPTGELASGNFLDPEGRQELIIDQAAQTCSGARPLSPEALEEWCSDKTEATRKSIHEAMQSYAAESLPGATVTTYGRAVSGRGQYTCCLGSCKANLGNFWGGLWRAQWQLQPDQSGQSGTLVGTVTCNVHYFEEGNVQLHDTGKFQKEISFQGDVGAAFAKQVRECESEWMMAMEDIYQTMSASVINALRRRLPMTKVKFNWDNMASVHKLATELNAVKTQ